MCENSLFLTSRPILRNFLAMFGPPQVKISPYAKIPMYYENRSAKLVMKIEKEWDAKRSCKKYCRRDDKLYQDINQKDLNWYRYAIDTLTYPRVHQCANATASQCTHRHLPTLFPTAILVVFEQIKFYLCPEVHVRWEGANVQTYRQIFNESGTSV